MYARFLLGSAGGALSVNTYLPVSADLSQHHVGAESLAIEGNYPFDDRVTMRLGVKTAKAFAVDFRVPAGATSMKIAIGGKEQKLQQTAAGFLRLQRTWQPGEAVRIQFEFPLKAHFHGDRDGKRWVAFTRGPLALAEEVSGGRTSDVEVPVVTESEDARQWLRKDQGFRYRIEGTGYVVIPYYLAGSTGAGVRTLFPVKTKESR